MADDLDAGTPEPVGTDPAPALVPPGDAIVASLATDVPLLLLPVRLVTRYHRENGADEPPTHLLVRIFPDTVHGDGHDERLSGDEVAIGHAYWERLWRAGGDPARRAAAHEWLFGLVAPPRAVWVASCTAPTNRSDAPTRPVATGTTLRPPPLFPPAGAEAPMWTVRAALLPERWSVTVLQNAEPQGRWWSGPVRPDLVAAPSLAHLPEGGTVAELFETDELRWLRDFAAGRDAGMAIRVPLARHLRDGPLDVVVAGARRGSAQEGPWAELLEHHRLSTGVEIVRPGTPTNNTETVASGFAARPGDPEAFLADQLGPAPRIDGPTLREPAALLTAPAAPALSTAFGFASPGPLERSAHRRDDAIGWAGAMNRALWPSTLGAAFRGPLRPLSGAAVGEEALGWARDWFARWVRGGGPLPALRIGTQPYGVLPVTTRPPFGRVPSTERERLEDLAWGLWSDWFGSLADVPALSPVHGEAGSPEDQAVAVAAILGAVPHPTAFRLRDAPVTRDALTGAWEAAVDVLEEILTRTTSNALDEFREREPDIRGASGLDGQDVALLQLGGLFVNWQQGGTGGGMADYQPALDHIDGVLRPLVAAHDLRSRARRYWAGFGGAVLPDADDPDLWYVTYGDDGSEPDGKFPTLELVPRGDPAGVAATLRGLADDARAVQPLVRPAVDLSTPRPLFRVMVDNALATAPVADLAEMATGLDALADMLERPGVPDPLGELTRLFRETLGLATHRLDAWITSVATERLARLRGKRPTGLQVGCYGWVVDLQPDEGGPDSSGFVHAPSLDHAATAAVLRSSWLAFARDAADAAFSVDLSSDRVRRATWLLDGVRNGIDLGELLGARFERRLHDARLDHLIDDIRDAVGGAAPAPGVSGTVVDGLLLASAYTDTARQVATDPVLVAVEALRTALTERRARDLEGILLESVADLDAVADVLLAQGVHSLVKGNLAQSAAALAAAGSGDSGIPELTVTDAHQASRTVTHRVVALFPAPERSGPLTARTLVELAEPALAAWVERLLGVVAATPVRIIAIDEEGRQAASAERTLGALGLRAVDVLGLVPPGGGVPGSRLERMVLALARAPGGPLTGHPIDRLRLDAALPGSDGATLADLAVAAGAVRGAVGRARPLTAADLSAGDDVTGEPDLDDLDRRRKDVVDRLRTLVSTAPSGVLAGPGLADLLAIDPDATIAALHYDDPAARDDHLAVVLDRARAARLLLEQDPEGWATMTPAARADDLRSRLERALATPLSVLPRVVGADVPVVRASASRSRRRLGSEVAAPAWLVEAGRVHPGAGALVQAVQLVEAVTGGGAAHYAVAQLPDVDGEGWVALERPVADGARLCLLAVDGFDAIDAPGFSGLVFDGWTETVPDGGTTTGLAVHLDSPGARPPQALLLTTPGGDAWDSDELVQVVRNTLDLARARAVGPETLQAWGHHLPAIFMPRSAVVAAVAIDPEEAS